MSTAPRITHAQVQGLWTSAETAQFLGVDEGTLRRWRSKRTGPPFIKVGRAVRYAPRRVAAWMEGPQ